MKAYKNMLKNLEMAPLSNIVQKYVRTDNISIEAKKLKSSEESKKAFLNKYHVFSHEDTLILLNGLRRFEKNLDFLYNSVNNSKKEKTIDEKVKFCLNNVRSKKSKTKINESYRQYAEYEECLVESNAKFAYKIANMYRVNNLDLFQLSLLGLLESIRRFDTKKFSHIKLTTYAKRWIQQKISPGFIKEQVIKLPYCARKRFKQIQKIKDNLNQQSPIESSYEDVSERSQLSLSQIITAVNGHKSTLSIHKPFTNGLTYESFLAGNSPDSRREVDNNFRKKVLNFFIEDLNFKERKIIRSIYFKGETFNQASKEFSFSRQRVNEIEKKARNKLEIKLSRLKDELMFFD